MQSDIRREIGETVSQQSIEQFLKNLFPIGSPSKIASIFMETLPDKSAEGLYELVLRCRNSQREFAKWIYSCIVKTNKKSEEEADRSFDTKELSEYLSDMTAISAESVHHVPTNEEDFIAFCMKSHAFQRSWNVLRSSSI